MRHVRPTTWIAALLIASLAWLAGCDRLKVQSYPKNLDPERTLVGRTFETVRDAYIFRWRNYQPPLPAFTTRPPSPGLGLPELPATVDTRFIDQKYETVIILGVLPKGTRFRVVDVRRISPEDHRYDIYEVEVLDPLLSAFPRLDAFWITDNRVDRDAIPSSFAAEFVKEVK